MKVVALVDYAWLVSKGLRLQDTGHVDCGTQAPTSRRYLCGHCTCTALLNDSAGETWVRIPARVPYPGGYRVLELTAGLKVISIACTPDLRDWGTLLGPLGTLMSLWLAG